MDVKKAAKIVLGTAAAAGVSYGVWWLNWYHKYCKLKPYTLANIKGTELEGTDIKLIAHRGYRAVAPENSLPAYEEAGKAGFWGAECDVYMTRDGVWVVHHDPFTHRVMDKDRFVELCTYDELLEQNFKQGHNLEKYPNLKVCTLEDFFKTCKKYNMHAVIELKHKGNQKHYDKIIELQKKYDVEADYIAFDFVDLVSMRKLTDADLYYLVYDIKDSQIKKALTLENCGISYDGDDKRNHANNCEMIRKCHEAGLKTATWAVDDVETIKMLYNAGTKYITTNAVTYE